MTSAERARSAAPRPARATLRVQIVDRYVAAATTVIASETGAPVVRGGLRLEQDPYTSDEVTAMIGISGALAGSVYLSMTEATALALVSAMLGQVVVEFDALAHSGIGELSNVIVGAAGVGLAELGMTTTITPPLLLVGAGARLSSVTIQRLVVPLQTACGSVLVHVALRPSG
jgi:chemotaxis protein CheX